MKILDNLRNTYGQLTGPKGAEKWLQWRKGRDKAITNPRRLKTVKPSEEPSPNTSVCDPAPPEKT